VAGSEDLNFDLPKNEDVLKKLIKEADFYRLEGLKDIIYNQLNTVQQIQPVGNVHLFDSLILTPELSKDLSKLCKFTHNQKWKLMYRASLNGFKGIKSLLL
jgi:hypothetical protein